MLPNVRAIYPKQEIIYVVEDNNSPVHRAKIVKKQFEEQNDIIRIDWPAISPDFNIIENIWSLVAKEWDNNKKRTKENLKSHVIKSWEKLRERKGLMENYSKSMNKRIN